MAKKDFSAEIPGDFSVTDSFVRRFQEQTLLFMKKNGDLTERQYGAALRLVCDQKRPGSRAAAEKR